MPRVLDPAEVAKLGLASTPAPSGPRVLGADEVSKLGLDDEGPSELESAARGGAQGLTFGFADEIAGGAQALLEKLRGAHEALGDLYVKHRDESRKNFDKAREANPSAYTAGNIAGAILPNAALAIGTGGVSIPEQLALGATSGALTAAGDAKEMDAQAAQDIALGGVTGGALGVVGGGLGKLGAKAIGKVGQGVEKLAAPRLAAAEEALATRGATEAAEGVASARGTAGKAVADANATLRTLREALADPGVSPERKQAVQAFLESPAGAELREAVVGNALEAAPDKVGAAQNAKALYQAAMEQEPEEAKRLAERYASGKYIGQQAMDRLKRYGPRAVTGTLGMLGLGAHGGQGLVEGAALGQIAGPAKDSLKRLAVLPGVQKIGFTALKRVGQTLQANPAALGKYGAVLARAAEKGPQELAAAHYALAQKSPEYQARLRALDEEGEPAEL